MFGAICAGRLVQTNLQQVSETDFVFQLEDAANINHIVVFLLPTNPFPADYGATVYFQWPGKEFQLLGGLSNAKPSAIFRVRNANTPAPGGAPIVANLGISVVPLPTVQEQLTSHGLGGGSNLPQQQQQISRPLPPVSVLAEKILRNLYNYLAGFATQHLPPGAQGLGSIRPGDSYVPLQAFQEWHQKFSSKFNNDPGFLDREDS